MNNTAKFARLVAVSVSAVWAAALFYSGVELDGHARRVLAYLPSAIGFLVVAFDLWLWKIPGVAHIAGRPRIYGTWKATLRPSSDSHIPPGGNRGPIIGAMVIEQTFWTTSVRFHTDQSSSKSSTSAIAPDTDSRQSKSFYFTYSNQAKQEHNARSYPHHGTTLLQIIGAEPKSVQGTYWTDRLTAGDVKLELIDRSTSHAQADALLAVQRAGN
jgi:SMODS-associating 2TM, beta-strand rich effector domain